MVKKIILSFILMNILNISYAKYFIVKSESKNIQAMLGCLSNIEKTRTKISRSILPTPYDYLLTQPLMTKGIEKYYRRTPGIQTLYAAKNYHTNTYFRVIKMFVDGNKTRNNVKLAQRKKEAIVVELAFITMNFNELSEKIMTDVLHTKIPFGQLLTDNHIKISTTDRSYFSLECNKELAALTGCCLKNIIYGRTNTILRVDNNKWLARVVEILPGHLSPLDSKRNLSCENYGKKSI